MDERDEMLQLLSDERDAALRQMADDLGVDWEELKAAEGSWAAAQAERDAETARALCRIDEVASQVAADVTHDWLRPAMSAAGFAPQDVERFEVTYVRSSVKPCLPIYCAKHYFGVSDAECVGAYQCPPVEEE